MNFLLVFFVHEKKKTQNLRKGSLLKLNKTSAILFYISVSSTISQGSLNQLAALFSLMKFHLL